MNKKNRIEVGNTMVQILKNEIILIKSTNINKIGLINYLFYLMADWYLEYNLYVYICIWADMFIKINL